MDTLFALRALTALVDTTMAAARAHAEGVALCASLGAIAILLARAALAWGVVRALDVRDADTEARAHFVLSPVDTVSAHLARALVHPLNVWMALLARALLPEQEAPPPLTVDEAALRGGARTALRAVLVAIRHQASAGPRSPRAVSVSLAALALFQVAIQTFTLVVTAALAGELPLSFVAAGAAVFAVEVACTLVVERALGARTTTADALARFITQPIAMFALPLVMLAALATSDLVRGALARVMPSARSPQQLEELTRR